MTKWAERPPPQSASASNHSSLNWQGSSHGPTGVKSWISFSFLALSNYPHPPTCAPSQSDYVWLASSLSHSTMPHNPSTATPALSPSAWVGTHSITAAHGPHCTLLLHSPEASKFNTYNLQLSVTSCLPLSIFPCFSPRLFLPAFHHAL